jgi:hypothetical protein
LVIFTVLKKFRLLMRYAPTVSYSTAPIEPYFLDQRVSAGINLFARQVEPVSFIRQHELRDQSENRRAAARGFVAVGALFDLLEPDQPGFELERL